MTIFPFFFFLIPFFFFLVVFRIFRIFLRGHWKRVSHDQNNWYIPSRFTNTASASPEAAVFRLAKRKRGVLTVSDVIVETGLNVSQAEELLQSLVDGVRVKMEVDQEGAIHYEFPELME
jgi:hypothetical protein